MEEQKVTERYESVADLYIRYYKSLLGAYEVTDGTNSGYKQEASQVALELVRQALLFGNK